MCAHSVKLANIAKLFWNAPVLWVRWRIEHIAPCCAFFILYQILHYPSMGLDLSSDQKHKIVYFLSHNQFSSWSPGGMVDADGSGEGLSKCPPPSSVDNIIGERATIRECISDVNCFVDQQCCETSDRISVCILRQSTITTTTTTAKTITATATVTAKTKTTAEPDARDSATSGDLSERGPDEPLAVPPSSEQNEGRNGTIFKVGNELVNRRYLLPADWESITFVDRKLRLNNGKIMSFLFYFEDTRAFLDGMFPGMRLQVCHTNWWTHFLTTSQGSKTTCESKCYCFRKTDESMFLQTFRENSYWVFSLFLQVWTPNITRKWAARIEYTLKCEKIVNKSDVTNTVSQSGIPVLQDEENEIGRDGLLVSVISEIN